MSYIYENYELSNNEIVNLKNAYDLGITDYKIGDLIALSEYRDTKTYIIGKEGKLIANPDFSDSGYLSIPYEITQYLDDAVNYYWKLSELPTLELKYNDKFLQDNIGNIPKSYNWQFILLNTNTLQVIFPNKNFNTFDVNNTSLYKIKKWYEGTLKENIEIKVYYEIKDESYDKFVKKYGTENYEWLYAKPKIPCTWKFWNDGGGGGHKSHHSNYTYKGPIETKDKVIKNINKFYKGFDYKINVI